MRNRSGSSGNFKNTFKAVSVCLNASKCLKTILDLIPLDYISASDRPTSALEDGPIEEFYVSCIIKAYIRSSYALNAVLYLLANEFAAILKIQKFIGERKEGYLSPFIGIKTREEVSLQLLSSNFNRKSFMKLDDALKCFEVDHT